MRCRVFAPWFCVAVVVALVSPVAAQSAPPASADIAGSAAPADSAGPAGSTDSTAPTASSAARRPVPLGHAALPGGLHAPSADTLPRGTFAVAALSGFGWRSGLLSDDHRFGRGIGNVAFAYAPLGALTLALAFDGRYDAHYGVDPSGDSNYVGDPRLIVRFAKPLGVARLGAQVSVWAPGEEAPSIKLDAISFEGRALIALATGPGTLGFSAGFRLDNSAKSVTDPGTYRVHERISLGVSEYNAIVGSAYFTMPAGSAFFGAEASLDLFVGSGADGGESPGPILRGGVHGGLHLSRQFSLLLFAEAARVPAIPADLKMKGVVPLIPYEPMITGGLGLQARFGGPSSPRKRTSHVVENKVKQDVTVIEYAELAGTVTDDVGQPIAGAPVTAKLKTHTATGVTGVNGEYVISRVPIGKTVNGATTLDDTGVEVTVSVANKKPGSSTATLTKGRNDLGKLQLDPLLPPGQLRAVVRAASTGRPLANATLTIEPGGITATTGLDGTVSVDLVPGTHKATATAQGYKPQTLDVTLDPNGVAIKNFELRK